jgi:hypothetical protein
MGQFCTPKCWLHSLVFQGFQSFAIKSSMQFISNTNMKKLQMGFQVMIVMDVLFMMHKIVGGTEVEM